MKCPTRIPFIIGGVLSTVALVCCLVIPQQENKTPSLQADKPTTGTHIQLPTGTTDPTEDTSVILPPEIQDATVPTSPTVEVEDEDREAVKDGTDKVTPSDKVTNTGKDSNVEQDVDRGEARNDAVLEEKEEAAQQQPPKEEHKIVVEEEKVTTGQNKGEILEKEETINPDGESNKNAPEFELAPGGDNPFDDDVETEITDTPVEDLIGEGEERPGGGIHF